MSYLVDTNVFSQLAATAHRHSLTMVTGNVSDFQNTGVKLFNPFAP